MSSERANQQEGSRILTSRGKPNNFLAGLTPLGVFQQHLETVKPSSEGV